MTKKPWSRRTSTRAMPSVQAARVAAVSPDPEYTARARQPHNRCHRGRARRGQADPVRTALCSLMEMSGRPVASWYPDPYGRHEFRYWDGGRWTQHVASKGRLDVDPPIGGPVVPAVDTTNKKVQRHVLRAGAAAGAQGGGTLFTESVLVVSQMAKLLEINAEYAVYDQNGQHPGSVREVGQSLMKRALAVRHDGHRTHRLQVSDADGRMLITLTRPAKVVRSKVIVRDASGAEIGQILQKGLGIIGKVRFVLQAGGRTLGSINAEGWDAWLFNIQDATGVEVARITKTWSGLVKEMFTKGDTYVVQIHRALEEPLRSLVVSAALLLTPRSGKAATGEVFPGRDMAELREGGKPT